MKIIINHVTVEYDKNLPNYSKALDDISLVINEGDFLGIAGHTGSGKSTLIQLMNGLIKPSKGNVYFEGEDIFEKRYDRKALRGKVGLLFQYPEHQLFAETVFEDVCFGPLNIGFDRKAAELSAYDALKSVGMPDDLFYQSPFNMSGGQMRRAALAGILALKPEVLILDEPTAGLDPGAQQSILGIIKKLHEEKKITIVLVSHNMDDIAEYTDRMIVLNKGRKVLDGLTKDVFMERDILKEAGLSVPQVTGLCDMLNKKSFPINPNLIRYEDVKRELLNILK
ncbi:MAG: energy-coupling factor transporter ATPase [Lachnospiraceae bacterium]|nr:energy-coupling factor transporter ATPase [Lachnospiraceae bacterium]